MYKFNLGLVGLGLSLLMWFIIGPHLFAAWRQVGPRLPLGKSSHTPILVDTEQLTRQEIKYLSGHVNRVVAYQTQPRLELVGIGHRLRERPHGQVALEIGLLPHRAQVLLKSDTRMELKMSAPSMILLLQELSCLRRQFLIRQRVIW